MPGAEPMGTDTSPCAKGTDLFFPASAGKNKSVFFPASAACCHQTFKLCVRRREGRKRRGSEGTREGRKREGEKKGGTTKAGEREGGRRGSIYSI